MGEFPVGFLLILLGGFIAALIVVFAAHAIKRQRVRRIQDPRKDHFKR